MSSSLQAKKIHRSNQSITVPKVYSTRHQPLVSRHHRGGDHAYLQFYGSAFLVPYAPPWSFLQQRRSWAELGPSETVANRIFPAHQSPSPWIIRPPRKRIDFIATWIIWWCWVPAEYAELEMSVPQPDTTKLKSAHFSPKFQQTCSTVKSNR